LLIAENIDYKEVQDVVEELSIKYSQGFYTNPIQIGIFITKEFVPDLSF
jgi:EAL domain-containing protein (putative c-di-GMP-specific phosphodiesterase class I)